MRVEVPNVDGIPSALRLRIDTKVYESGGRQPATASSHRGLSQLRGDNARCGSEMGMEIAGFTSSMLPAVVSPFPTRARIHHLPLLLLVVSMTQADFRRHYKSNGDTVILSRAKCPLTRVAYLRHTLQTTERS